MQQFLDFEKPIAELESKIDELRQMSDPEGANIAEEISRLKDKADKQLAALYARLSAWQKVLVARHEQRPHALDYISGLITEYVPLAGDRHFAEDSAIVGGLGRFEGMSVMIVGIERGSDLQTRLTHNFGMAKPEGYRKHQRLLDLAGRFGLPVLAFIDTAGAWPGIDAEERGQAEAIARSIEATLSVPTPVVATIIGEGGSGGAIALGAADQILMLEHAIYSVISPEACASILWRDPKQAVVAAGALRLTAQDLLNLKLIDRIVPEPTGGAQRNPQETIKRVGEKISIELAALTKVEPAILRARRREKFLAMSREIIS
ncbi:acetyl-CoA carboxylase carboxyltransferase subunit alpha [Entomobacter blattae]|uniref:Acetyl-coenzyme A carboxylase carboxyl transferase subunit alpha n=1 Tax=Entomobacter blattae TaxID=2762277 RepID=A0A7H1NUU8_9PROT|nr:acetyl-CoA carboxylase carboxyltransferase subunit alpha [Entomobacter blattae]QNT79558.1 Acetyl-coenzyme A carboxylase carboxyl transferase subunit alpha [Entomobacter blattae]